MADRVGRRAYTHAFATITCGLLASCGGPTKPTRPDPPVVGPATPPIIRSIAVPTSRVEAGTDIAITAIVEDAETPLTALAYQWSASAGTITGNGTSATWRVPGGLKAGIDVTVTLTVTDTYDAVENNVIVKRQFVVPSTSVPFRVHDSVAEVKELARKFLVDLFGDSSIAPEACLVDFADSCATLLQGKVNELEDIINHRAAVVVTNVETLNQKVTFFGPAFGTVHSAMNYTGHKTNDSFISSGCGDYETTMVYVGNRWWICESYFHPDDKSFCPAHATNSELDRILRRVLKGGGR
jgi:hypothetical protein